MILVALGLRRGVGDYDRHFTGHALVVPQEKMAVNLLDGRESLI